jgi:flavin-dependent dehydrogenase
LAQAGVAVILVDRLLDLRQGAFSSAALPLAALSEFGLPAELVASRWSQWQLLGPKGPWRQWQATTALGAVMDFGGLRHWLARQAQAWGAELRLGWTVQSTAYRGGVMCTSLRGVAGARLELESDWVIDATGAARALVGALQAEVPLVTGVGLEWLLAVDQCQWSQWQDRLSFVLGSRWVPQGYGWVFPMAPGQLKLGVCRLVDAGRGQPALHQLQQRLLELTGLGGAQVLDRHGGLIRSSIQRRESHGEGRLLGLGDAVSTANLLGGEGIRHAMASARVLAGPLLKAITSKKSPLPAYRRGLTQKLGWRWPISGRLARRTWMGLHSPKADQRLEQLLVGLEGCRAEELSALLFNYQFERYGPRLCRYLLGR